MTIRQMTTEDRAQAAQMWMQIFGDSEAFTDWYFRDRFEPMHSFAAFENDRLIAMTLGRDTKICVQGKVLDALLISGVSTLPEHRGKGLMHALVGRQIEHAKEADFACCYLHPVAESLYAKLGFQNGTYALIVRSETAQPHSYTITEQTDISVMKSVYDALMPRYNGMQLRDKAEIALLIKDYEADGLHTLIARDGGRPVGYICYLDDGTVSELFALNSDAYCTLLNEAAKRMGQTLTAIVPTDCGLKGERVYSMQYLVFRNSFDLPLYNGFCRLSY